MTEVISYADRDVFAHRMLRVLLVEHHPLVREGERCLRLVQQQSS
jgi:hypothetical protein